MSTKPNDWIVRSRIDAFKESPILRVSEADDHQLPMRRALLPQGRLSIDQPSSGDGIR